MKLRTMLVIGGAIAVMALAGHHRQAEPAPAAPPAVHVQHAPAPPTTDPNEPRETTCAGGGQAGYAGPGMDAGKACDYRQRVVDELNRRGVGAGGWH